MKTMSKFTRASDNKVIAIKAFGIELVEENEGTCTITVHGVQEDGEWRPVTHEVIGTMAQVCAEIDK